MRLLFTGNIDNIAYSCAKFSRWLGVQADVLVSSSETGNAHPFWEDGEAEAAPIMRTFAHRKGVSALLSLRELRRVYQQYDVVVSMGKMSISTLLLRRPYVAIALGADMKELVFKKSLMGWLMDRAFRSADVLLYNDVDHLPALEAKKYEEAYYFPVPIDVDKYRPPQQVRRNGKLLLVHGAALSWSLDWTSDKELHRRTLKRNDIFFEGCQLFLEKSRVDLEVVVPLWGPDSDKVKPLCERLGIAGQVKFVPKLTKAELLDLYHRADIVIDQFNMPRLGYNAFEAMACSRPVVGHFSQDLQRRLYPELPPMLSARSPAEVATSLEQLMDEDRRREMGESAREWVLKYHHWKPVMETLLDHCRKLA